MFRYCKDTQEIKQLFRKLSKLLHPDTGGDAELMSLLIRAKEDSSKNIKETTNTPGSSVEDYDYFEQAYGPVDLSDDIPNQMIEIMVDYAKSHENFDPAFLIKMKDIYEEKGEISAGQYNALLRVFTAFRMEEWNESAND